jgi:hypothetical protein
MERLPGGARTAPTGRDCTARGKGTGPPPWVDVPPSGTRCAPTGRDTAASPVDDEDLVMRTSESMTRRQMIILRVIMCP